MRHPRALVLLLLAAACSGGDEAALTRDSPGKDAIRPEAATPEAIAQADVSAEPASPAAGADAGLAAAPLPAAPMLIRTGSATVVVDTLERGVAAVRALAARHGGYVGGMSLSGGTRAERFATLEVRIPSQRFDAALAGLNPLGQVESVDVSAQDVGEEYADVEARVANARRLESRLLELLERRTGRLDELLQLEREVARVREEIERYEGRMRYLRTRASVSTLAVTLREPEALIGSRAGERPIRDAFRRAWENFVALLAGLIAASGVLLPLAVLVFLAWRIARHLRRRSASPPPAP